MAINFLNDSALPDNAKLTFGAAPDFEIYHNSTTNVNWISSLLDRQLTLSSNYTYIKNQDQDEIIASFLADGAVTLYYNAASKFATTNTGVSITGGFVTTASSDCAGLNMTADIAMGSNDITDSNTSAGTAGQVLSSLGAGNGTDWIDAATGTVTGTGVSSRVSYWNGTSSQTSTAGFTFDGSNLAVPGNITATAGALSAGTTVTSTTSMSAGSTMTIGTIAEVGSDTDKFLMSDSGVVKYVTGANLRSYIGAGTGSGTVTSVGITAGTGISVSGSPVTGSGSITVTNTAPATIDGSGAANQVAYWSDSDTLTGSNDLTYNGTTLALAGDNEVLNIGTGGTGTTSLFAWTGSTFYIQQDSASGAIQVETDNFLVKNHGAGETYIEATDGGSVDLYHNNVKTFETTAAGATVTGDISITGGDITTNGVQTFSNSSSADALLIGDTTGGDTISTIDLWVMGTSQAQVEDGAVIIQNNATLQLNSGSDIALNGDANIRLDASIAANQSSGIVLPLGSTSVTVNNVYYWKASSVWELTDADTEAKTNGLLAYANSSGTASTNRMVLQGIVFDSGHGFTIGAPLYIHTTAGALSNTAPSGTADCVRVVGYAITSDEIYFCPDNTWVKVS
jgi:hypothetical protein